MEIVSQRHSLAAFLGGKDPVPIVQETEWTPESVWTGVGKKKFLSPAAVRTSDNSVG